jgi:hypothetical protein
MESGGWACGFMKSSGCETARKSIAHIAVVQRAEVGWVERSETHHAALRSKEMGFYGYGLANLFG